MPFKFDVELSGFKEARKDLEEIRARADFEVPEATRDMIDRIYDEAVEAINKSSSAGEERQRPFHTWETIEQDVERRGFAEAEGVTGTSDFIAKILERGSRSHEIRPRQGKRALRFRFEGQMRYFARVHHPGTPPYRWWSRSLLLADAYNRQRWHKAARRILYGEDF